MLKLDRFSLVQHNRLQQAEQETASTVQELYIYTTELFVTEKYAYENEIEKCKRLVVAV